MAGGCSGWKKSGHCWEGFARVCVLGLRRAARPQHSAYDPVPQPLSLRAQTSLPGSHRSSSSSPGLSGRMRPPAAGSTRAVPCLGSSGLGSVWDCL